MGKLVGERICPTEDRPPAANDRTRITAVLRWLDPQTS
jgi:hypothetical protein